MNETVVKEHFCRNGKQQQKHFAEGCACTGAALKLLSHVSRNPFLISTFLGTDMFMNIRASPLIEFRHVPLKI